MARPGRRDARSAVLDVALARTALWSGTDAVDAWSQRPADFDLDEIWNPARHRLLGRIGITLAAAGCTEPDLPRLSGIARKQWVEHQLVAVRLRPLLKALGEAGVAVWLVGGGAIGRASWGYDGQLGARSADDTRLLVRRSDALRAISVLSEIGLRFPSPARCDRRVEWLTSVPMQFADESWSELSWSVSPYLPASTEPDPRGETVMLGDVPVQLISAELTLVQICADSEWSPRHRGLGWLVDVERLLTQGACDLRIASQLADAAGLSGVVDRRLAVYRAAYEGAPGGEWLAECPVTSSGSQRLRADIRAFGRGRSLWERWAGVGQFMADRWFLDSVRQVPGAAVRRCRIRARRDHRDPRRRRDR